MNELYASSLMGLLAILIAAAFNDVSPAGPGGIAAERSELDADKADMGAKIK